MSIWIISVWERRKEIYLKKIENRYIYLFGYHIYSKLAHINSHTYIYAHMYTWMYIFICLNKLLK